MTGYFLGDGLNLATRDDQDQTLVFEGREGQIFSSLLPMALLKT
jgi:hypothetical protein